LEGSGSHGGCLKAGFAILLSLLLRPSAVRNLVRFGVRRSVVKKITGDKTDAVFSRYDTVDQSDIADARRKLGAFLERGNGDISGTNSAESEVAHPVIN
jgi:hypothetical protein